MTREDDIFKCTQSSWDEFHSVFDFKARIEKWLSLEKTGLHLEVLIENKKIILLKCILCLLYCIPASAVFFFSSRKA